MTFINEFTTYCAICGGPVADPVIDKNWLSQAVLLHSSIEFPNKEIQELPAKNPGGPYFKLLSNSEAVTACDNSGSIVPSPKPLYIACHQKCVSLAKRCIISHVTAAQRSGMESIQHIWLVLVNLFERASVDKMGPICNIYNAQAYGDIWRFQELVWEPSSDPDEAMHFEAEPEDIPDMTKVILSHLQHVSSEKVIASSSEALELPPAMQLGLEWRFDYHPSAWRQGLSTGYLPWLWDLGPTAMSAKEASKLHGQDWNWELLVRQLAQVNLHEPKAVLVDMPAGLRNRRRIWRIVEDMLSAEADSYYDTQWPK